MHPRLRQTCSFFIVAYSHPKAGIGNHFHNQMEEMFVILDNQAQFTLDGRTSTLIGPLALPVAWATPTVSTIYRSPDPMAQRCGCWRQGKV